MPTILTVGLAYLLALVAVIATVELLYYLRRRMRPTYFNTELASHVADSLGDGLAEADSERAERKGKLYTEAQKDAHRKALRGRLKLCIDKYITACKGAK